MTAIPKTKMSLEEYFELDKNAEGNFEYFDGEIFEMSGVSPNHARIERNLLVKTSPRASKVVVKSFHQIFVSKFRCCRLIVILI